MKKIHILIVFIALTCCSSVYSQTSGKRLFFSDSLLVNTSKVYAYGSEKKLAWCGGVNSPNFAMADLNNDGKNDLVIVEDYFGPNMYFLNSLKTFINRGTAGAPNYVYEPKYQLNFPIVKDIIKLLDYNCDNIPDMITWQGLRLFKGYYNVDNELCFTYVKEIMYFNPALNREDYINVNYPEIPSILDIDNDTDPDIIAIGQSGNVSLYRNMRIELGLNCDSILFRLKDRCWGRFQQNVQREHQLNLWCDNSDLKTTHGANSLTLFDHEGDGDFDVLDGNFSFSDLQYLNNGKADHNYPVDSMIWQDTVWQSNGHQLHMAQFPASFWLDIDQDGLNDILVSPHGTDAGENYKCIAYYKNTGTPGNYTYTYQSDTFLVDEMIDVGSASYPTLYDYDKDGKPDLFIGSDGYFQNGLFRSKLTHYRNTSTPGNISFELVTGDFLSLNNFEGAAPAMGDIDDDGKDDLVIGKGDGSLVYYKNMAATANDQPNWGTTPTVLRDASMNNINVGYNAAPVIYDIDKDGKKDLIIGCVYGTLHYYKNVSTVSGTIMLQKVTETLGGVRSDPGFFSTGYSTPFIGKLDDSGIDYLLMGSSSGALYRYDGFQNGNTTTPYVLIDTLYSEIVLDSRTAPVVGNIDGDTANKMEMIIGNLRGGLNLYQQRFAVGVTNVPNNIHKVEIYPNPAAKEVFMHLDGPKMSGTASVSVYNSMGQVVSSNEIAFDNKTLSIDIASYPAGIYLCHIRFDHKVYTGKFTKE